LLREREREVEGDVVADDDDTDKDEDEKDAAGRRGILEVESVNAVRISRSWANEGVVE